MRDTLLTSNSLKRNAIANYIGQTYVMAIGIIITPFYLQYLGAESYGLIGFFALLYTWLNLLDVGLTPTLGRQIAFARGKPDGFVAFKKLLKSFELIFLILSILAALSIYFSSYWLATEWISATELSSDTIAYCITLMGLVIGLRWFAGLYRSGISGLEDQVWLNFANIFISSLKFLGALFLLAFITNDVRHFFEYQLVIGIIEVLIFVSRFYSKLPVVDESIPIFSFHLEVVKSVAPFALGIAYSTGIWIFVSQVDKLVLSGTLLLSEFGYFSLVVLVASAITVLSSPISMAIQPRMTYLLSSGKESEMLKLYRNSTQLVVLTSMSVSLVVAFFAETIIYAWTGNQVAAMWAKDVLFWYALGNGILAVFAFQYYLQVSYGKLGLHVRGSTIAVFVDVPVIVYIAINYGALGAGIAWFILRVIWWVLWTPIVHKRFTPGLHLKWLFKDVMPIMITTIFAVLLANQLFQVDKNDSRLELFIVPILSGVFVITLSALSSSFVRERVFKVVFKNE